MRARVGRARRELGRNERVVGAAGAVGGMT